MSTSGRSSASADAKVRMVVAINRLEAVVRIMMNTVLRTGRSGVLNTARDLSCCIVTADAQLVVSAESIAVHVLRGPDLMAEAMMELHPDLRPGDAFLHNSPYHGNSHAADHTIMIPVFDGAGVHRFTVVSKTHQADCGSSQPTTYMASARDVYEEGALIFPAVKIQENYENCWDIIRMCRERIRVPDQWWGDFLASLGGARIGEREVTKIGEDIGWDALDGYVRGWLDYSEERMASVVGRLPRATVRASTAHDPIPQIPTGLPLSIEIAVDPDQGVIDVDLRDNIDCQPCGLNLSRGIAESCVLIGLFNSIGHQVPGNAGSFRRVRIQLRENCIAGGLKHPASCSAGTTNLAERLANLVQRAMADLGDGIGRAESGVNMPPAMGVLSGHDPRHGNAPFVNEIFMPAWTGGAGGPDADGWLTEGSACNGGALYRDSVEMAELHQPILIHEQRILPDTEGAGRRRGTPSGRVEYGPVGCDLTVVYCSDGRITPPMGARGGLPGGRAAEYRRLPSGELVELEFLWELLLEDGETVVSVTCGAGGYGPPAEREPARVQADLAEGWITRERAENVYRVVFDENGEVDLAATRVKRDGPPAAAPGRRT